MSLEFQVEVLFHLFLTTHPCTVVTQRQKILRELHHAELTLHERAKPSLCRPSLVFPAKLSPFLITAEGNKTILKRCLQFPIMPYKIQKEGGTGWETLIA